jgi:hypothetical protein
LHAYRLQAITDITAKTLDISARKNGMVREYGVEDGAKDGYRRCCRPISRRYPPHIVDRVSNTKIIPRYR